jgi:hypothetical protein
LKKSLQAPALWKVRVSRFVGLKQVRRILESITVNEEKNYEGGCRCAFGDGILAFYSGPNLKTDLITYLTLHHWGHLDWEGWPDNGELTAKSIYDLKLALHEYECIAENTNILPRD